MTKQTYFVRFPSDIVQDYDQILLKGKIIFNQSLKCLDICDEVVSFYEENSYMYFLQINKQRRSNHIGKLTVSS